MPTFVSLGKDYEIKNFPITTSASEITFDRPIKSFILQSEDATNLEFTRLGGGNKWTIKGGAAFSGDVLFTYTSDSVSIGFIRTVLGKANLQVIGIF